MGGSSHLSYAVGGVILAGGAYAYIAKKSITSLVGASVIAGPMILGGLIAIGATRFWQTKKVMPAVPTVVIGIISSAYHNVKALEWMNN